VERADVCERGWVDVWGQGVCVTDHGLYVTGVAASRWTVRQLIRTVTQPRKCRIDIQGFF
jgi:hypothetical protein